MPFTIWLRRIDEHGNHHRTRIEEHQNQQEAYDAARRLAGDETARVEGNPGTRTMSVDGPNGRVFIDPR